MAPWWAGGLGKCAMLGGGELASPWEGCGQLPSCFAAEILRLASLEKVFL